MVYFLLTLFYISFIISIIYFNNTLRKQNSYITSLIKEKTNSIAKIIKVVEESEANLKKFEDTYKDYSDKLNIITKDYKAYKTDWNNNSAALKNLLGQFELKHDNVETKFNNKELELKKTFESFKKMYDEMHFYLANSTRKLESRPEEVRRELIKELKEVKKYVFNLSTQHSDHVIKTEKEYLTAFNELSKLADKVVLKKDPSRRSY
jgi:hypothetical protein